MARIGNLSVPEANAAARAAGPASLGAVFAVTFLGSVTGGVFWSGIFFVTHAHYAFSAARNLCLALSMGIVYAVVARAAGRIASQRERGVGPRRVLAESLVAWAAGALLPLAFPRVEAVLWVAALVGAAASGLIWPIVESYLGAGRHGAELRRALGWFNVVWTSATALSLLLLPLLAEVHALGALGLSALMNAGALLALRLLPVRPGDVQPERAHSAVGREYALLLRSVSWLLPLSYLMSSTLSPVLPHRLAALGAVVPESIIAATWMLGRFFTLAVMTRITRWHGRWGVLAFGALALGAGLGLALLGSSLSVVVAGLMLFGVGMGVTYYTAIYYSLTVGHAAVDAGGGFEALIGFGYVLGPAVGLVGRNVSLGIGPAATTVALTACVAAAGGVFAVRPYLAARRARRVTALPPT